MKTCPGCGKTLSPSASFCPFCGARFDPRAGAPSPARPVRRPPPQSSQPQPTAPAEPAAREVKPQAPAPVRPEKLERPEPAPKQPAAYKRQDVPLTPEAGEKTVVQPMTAAMLAELQALRAGTSPQPAPPPAKEEPAYDPDATRALDIEVAEPVADDDDGSTRMLDIGNGAEDPDDAVATRVLEGKALEAFRAKRPAAHEAPTVLEEPLRAPAAQPAPRAQAAPSPRPAPTAPSPPRATAAESLLPALPQLSFAPEDALAGPVPETPLGRVGYAFRHLKAHGVAKFAELLLERRATFLRDERRNTLVAVGQEAWREGLRRPDLQDSLDALDAARAQHEELTARLREQEGTVATEKEAIEAELQDAREALLESDQSLVTLVQNLRAAENELRGARRELSTRQKATADAKKELAALQSGKGGKKGAAPADTATRTAVLEAEIAKNTAAAAPLAETVTSLESKRASLAEAEASVRAKVTPARQRESQLRARLAAKDREAAARTQTTRDELAALDARMAVPARQIGEALMARRAEMPQFEPSFQRLDAIAAVAASDEALGPAFQEARQTLDDAAAKKGWILFGGIAGGVIVLLVILSVIF